MLKEDTFENNSGEIQKKIGSYGDFVSGEINNFYIGLLILKMKLVKM